MIIIPQESPQEDKFLDLDSVVTDGIYVVPEPNGKIYRLREVILQMKRLGRMLTEEELKAYELSNC